MESLARRPLILYREVPRFVLLLSTYLPFAFLPEALALGDGRWIMLLIGAYLIASTGLRLLPVSNRAPVWLMTAWLLLDTIVWLTGQRILQWDNTPTKYISLFLALDAATIGRTLWHGLFHAPVFAALLSLGPLLLGETWDRDYQLSYIVPTLIGVMLAFGFAKAFQVDEERAAAAQARKEAELANAQLREYARQVEELAVLRERNRMAREIHDTIAHAFTGIIIQMDVIKSLWEIDPGRALLAVEGVQEKARESLSDVRRSVHALRPLHLEEQQGVAALERMADTFTVSTGVQVGLTISGPPVPLPAAHELCLYRAVQEGLTNAYRHGGASRVEIALAYAPESLSLTVADDGSGMAEVGSVGLGLLGIQERAEILGGHVHIGAREDGGFSLRVTLPLPA